MEQKQPDVVDIFAVEERPGAVVFALAVCLGVLVLLVQMDEQTKWLKGTALLVQPRFWPGLCLAGFAFFALCHFISTWARHRQSRQYSFLPPDELANWARPTEYALYFMAYVFLVPQLGYLPTTLLTLPALVFRLGYRSPSKLMASILVGLCTVVVFKTLLQVRIPGGRWYEFLPDGLRNLLILYF